jgi:hypothetical protein
MLQTHQMSATVPISEPDGPRHCRRQIAKYRRAHLLHGRSFCTSHSEPQDSVTAVLGLCYGFDRHIASSRRGTIAHHPRRLSPPAACLPETLDVFASTLHAAAARASTNLLLFLADPPSPATRRPYPVDLRCAWTSAFRQLPWVAERSRSRPSRTTAIAQCMHSIANDCRLSRNANCE